MARTRVINSWWQRKWVIPRRGKDDGRKKIPAADAEQPSEFEKKLASIGREFLNQISRSFREKIEMQEGRLNSTVETLRNLVEKYKMEYPVYNARKKLLGRDITIHLSRRWYIVFILLIVLGEFALNSQAFDVFGKAPWLTYLMALTVAVGIPVVAHFMGLLVRQWPKPTLKTVILLIVLAGLLILCLVGINTARLRYMEMWHPEEVAGTQMLQNAFLFINLFIFLCAALMAFFAHDSDSELQNLHERVVKLEAAMDATDRAIHNIASGIDRLWVSLKAETETSTELLVELIHIYRGENERNREDGVKPAFFDTNPRSQLEIAEYPDFQRAVPQDEIDSIRAERRAAQEAYRDR